MRGTARRWIVGGPVVAGLLWVSAAWVRQLVLLLTGCGGGLGNPGMTGRLTGESCVISDERPLVELPWHQDAWIAGLAVLSLGCVVAALLTRRWSPRLAVAAVPALVFAGAEMGVRGVRRATGSELIHYAVPVTENVASEAGREGWKLFVSEQEVFIPDVGTTPLVVGFLAGLGLLGLVVVLLREQHHARAS
ncbi:hypothetical protein LZ318_04000 [Saccharopolyspora indica]|uniref:hypothetical protein n=1 Tax=Saccharopolyspora indica TaxID=1229659 RepID=UPI002FE5B325